jgi:DNA-binding GntR family transcriptional regulator
MEIYLPLQIKAYSYLKSIILNKQLVFGVVYSETKYAKEIGISRTPMRDAVQRLAQEGYIDLIPNKGFILHKMTLQDSIDIYQIRCAIEGFCCLQLAKGIQTEKVQKVIIKLEDSLKQQENVINGNNSIPEFTFFDNLFHQEIVNSLENETMNDIFNNYLHRIDTQTSKTLEYKDRMKDAYSEHKKIFDTIKNGDVDQIYFVTMEHLEKPKWIMSQMTDS